MLSLVDEAVDAYAEAHTAPVPPLLLELRELTYARMQSPQMQVGRIEGTLLKLLVQLTGARRVVEVGTFTGYSALMMASGLPEDGQLLTCEVDEEVAAVARSFFARSEHGSKIELRLGPAADTLKSLAPPVDLVFLDADKESYPLYFELALPLLRPGGLLVADNTLWSGRVAKTPDEADEASTRALRAFNRLVASEPRVEPVLLTVRDGITLARKR